LNIGGGGKFGILLLDVLLFIISKKDGGGGRFGLLLLELLILVLL
jgi:hypothetical protein